jgi:hypothetical protein
MGATASGNISSVSSMDTDLQDNDMDLDQVPDGMIIGENDRAAFGSTNSAALDFFFQVVPGIEQQHLHKLLKAAWDENANMALRLIFQTGNSRKDDGGKMDQENWRTSLFWLSENHPTTVLANLEAIPKHTYLKDLLELLVHATQMDNVDIPIAVLVHGKNERDAYRKSIRNPDVKRKRRLERDSRRLLFKEEFAFTMKQPLDDLLMKPEFPVKDDGEKGTEHKKQKMSVPSVRWVSEAVKGQWESFVYARDSSIASEAKLIRKNKQAILDERNSLDSSTYVEDLGARIATIFADGLLAELKTLAENPVALGGLYAKWAPTVDGLHDKQTRIVDKITPLIFVNSITDQERCVSLSPIDLIKSRRVEYSKILSKLRCAAKIPEHYIGNGKWSEIDYNRMPSRCRILYGDKIFAKYDKSRYETFLDEAESAALAPTIEGVKVKSVKTTALLPHEVTEKAWKAYLKVENMVCPYNSDSDEEKETTLQIESSLDRDKMVVQECNLMWHGIVAECKKAAAKGSGISSWVPMCDVSGSMSGIPMEVSIALSLLLAEVNTVDSGWKGKMFTFDSTPRLITMFDESDSSKLVNIGELVHKTRAIPWGGSTDLDLAMDLFLANAIANDTTSGVLAQQALVIFSDMEFDDSFTTHDPWETVHESILSKFVSAGYPQIPKIVFWNLRASQSIPIQKKETIGVVLLSGFSSGLLKSFLSGNLDEFTPEAQLKAVLDKEIYASLVVAADQPVNFLRVFSQGL